MLTSLLSRDLLHLDEIGHGAAGRGKCSVYSLTSDGSIKLREILMADTEKRSSRPVPVGIALALPVKRGGLCFLES
jgi:hypothetical protein